MNQSRPGESIRRAGAEDAGPVVEVINAVCREGLYLSTPRYVPTPEWEMVLHAPHRCGQHLLLVPEVEGRVVGWCRVFTTQAGQGDVGLGLLPPYREQGIGTALMERVLAWAEGQQLARLTAGTFLANRRAINLFKKMGFVIAGRQQVQDRRVMLHMQREL